MHRSFFIAGAVPLNAPGNNEGPSTLTPVQKEALLTFLGIPVELRFTPPTLRNSYIKYKACINASQAMSGLRANKEWPTHLEEQGVEYWVPIFVDLVNIFIAKSQFYSSWKIPFGRAQNYPQMKSWLEDNSDCESESEIWAETKNSDHYTLLDLAQWLNKKDAVKGKKPAIASSSKEKKSAGSKEKRKKERRMTQRIHLMERRQRQRQRPRQRQSLRESLLSKSCTLCTVTSSCKL